MRSFNSAHNLILQEEGMLTTLTAVLVLPLTTPGKYIACCCNVGDSLAYVYNPRYGVRELTQGTHFGYKYLAFNIASLFIHLPSNI